MKTLERHSGSLMAAMLAGVLAASPAAPHPPVPSQRDLRTPQEHQRRAAACAAKQERKRRNRHRVAHNHDGGRQS